MGESSTKAAGRKTSKSSTQCLKAASRGVTDGARWSGGNVGQENSYLFSCVSKSQQETSWCPYLLCPLLPTSQNLPQRPRLQEGARKLVRNQLPGQTPVTWPAGWVLGLTVGMQPGHLSLCPLHSLLHPATSLGKQDKIRVQVRCSPAWPKGLSDPLLSRGLCLGPLPVQPPR